MKPFVIYMEIAKTNQMKVKNFVVKQTLSKKPLLSLEGWFSKSSSIFAITVLGDSARDKGAV